MIFSYASSPEKIPPPPIKGISPEDMLKSSPMGLRLTKEGLNLAVDAGSLEAAVALEDRGQILCATAGFFDEGIAAFKEKRSPIYDDN